jgi:hypothetical protein
MVCRPAHPEEAALITVRGPALDRRQSITPAGSRGSLGVTLPPGHSPVRFACAGRPHPLDPRNLLLRVDNPTLREVTDGRGR